MAITRWNSMPRGNRKGLELSEPEARILMNLASKEVTKQIAHGNIDPDTVGLLKKVTKVVQGFNQSAQTSEPQ